MQNQWHKISIFQYIIHGYDMPNKIRYCNTLIYIRINLQSHVYNERTRHFIIFFFFFFFPLKIVIIYCTWC